MKSPIFESIIIFIIITTNLCISNNKKRVNIIIGHPNVLKGDTIIIDNEKLRLYGIDSPELDQICEGKHVGEQAKTYLIKLIGKNKVKCRSREVDKHGIKFAICNLLELDIQTGIENEGNELNRLMVKSGYAFNYDFYTNSYKQEEKQAMNHHLPVWGDKCIKPYKFRKMKGDL